MATKLFRTFIRTPQGKVPPETKTVTRNQSEAKAAFAELVERVDLDGQKLTANLSCSNLVLARHRFDRLSGQSDYWRDRLDEIEWPEPAGAGRPTEMRDGKQVTVYLDAISLETAQQVGDGNVSAGIRAALVQAQKKLNRARKEK